MKTIDFFNETPLMRMLRGDTSPELAVRVELEDTTGYTMRVVLENLSVPGSVALVKQCQPFGDETGLGWNVVLTSEETAALLGTYRMHFILTSPSDLEYRKLVGTLHVLDVPQEVES